MQLGPRVEGHNLNAAKKIPRSNFTRRYCLFPSLNVISLSLLKRAKCFSMLLINCARSKALLFVDK